MHKVSLNIENDIYEYLNKYAREHNMTVTTVIHEQLDKFTGDLASQDTADIVTQLLNNKK